MIKLKITIKKYESKDEGKFRNLISLCHEDEYLINIVNSPKLKFAYSAFFENELIGIMFGWTSSFHPYCTYFRILSNPFYKWIRIEEKMIAMVEEMETINQLQTSIWETSVNLKKFYEDNGFIEIRRTYMPMLKVTDAKQVIANTSENVAIKSLTEVMSNDLLVENLIHIVKRNYENTHLVNPVAAMGIDEWKNMIFADDLVLSGSYVYLDNDEKQILAYSFFT